MASVTSAEKRILTLGEIIDGYLHLSDAEKGIFQIACLGNQATTVASGSSKEVPKGHTVDPKTGKVFKLLPKKEKTPERIRLETHLADAKRQWSALVREQGFTLDDDGRPDPPIADPAVNRHAATIARAMGNAKTALASYKEAHPEEFLPPPNKGKSSKTTKKESPPSKPVPRIPSPKGDGAAASAKPPTSSPKGKSSERKTTKAAAAASSSKHGAPTSSEVAPTEW